MKYIESLKFIAAKNIEKSSILTQIAIFLLNRFDFLLPHETDYHGINNLFKSQKEGFFLDIGANYGQSIRSVKKMLPDWHILSIEANPGLEKRLYKISRKYKNVKYIINAVSDKSGDDIKLLIPRQKFYKVTGGSSIVKDHFKDSKFAKWEKLEVTTKTIKIDDLPNIAPDFIKLDIEGAEYNALKGAKNIISRHHPIILVEKNPYNFSEITELLNRYGYEAYRYSYSDDKFYALGEDGEVCRNVFFIPQKKKCLLRGVG